MSIITKIEQQKNNKERYNIYISNDNNNIEKSQHKNEVFLTGVYQDVIIQHNLRVGSNIDQNELEEIILNDNIYKGFNKTLKLLAIRMKTVKEIILYLEKNEFDIVSIEKIIDKLLNYNYLNDLEYAKLYLREQLNKGNKGPNVIRNNLLLKGIDNHIIEQLLETYTHELQIEHIFNYIQKKLPTKNRKSLIDFKNSTYQQLITHGYNREVIEIALNNYLAELDNNIINDQNAILHQGMKLHNKYKHLAYDEYLIKMKTALYRKGFKQDDIANFLDDIQHN